MRTLQDLQSVPRKIPRLMEYIDYSPLRLTVPAANIRNGSYQNFQQMQNYRRTWFIGSLSMVGSSQIFNNTKGMIPDIVAASLL